MKNKWKENKWGITVFVLGLIFIEAGIYRQEIVTVFTKAAAICLECIGVG